MNTINIEWKDPEATTVGPRGSRHDQYKQVSETLRANPNRWALVATDTIPVVAMVIKNGKSKHFRPAGSFEATVRGTKKVDGKMIASEIYARYVGEK